MIFSSSKCTSFSFLSIYSGMIYKTLIALLSKMVFVAPAPWLDGWAPITLEIFNRGTKKNIPHFFKDQSHIAV